MEDFSCEHLGPPSIANLKNIIKCMNDYREEFLKDYEKHNWWQMIQLLPSSYNQTRNVMLNYEVLTEIYRWRKDHKLDEWREFCKWIESLPYSELIVDLPFDITKYIFSEPFPWVKNDKPKNSRPLSGAAKAAQELDPIVNECPCSKCSDDVRMTCEKCSYYYDWISRLKG